MSSHTVRSWRIPPTTDAVAIRITSWQQSAWKSAFSTLARIAMKGGSGVARISIHLQPVPVATLMPNPNTITLPTL